jgi:hypothetical protein
MLHRRHAVLCLFIALVVEQGQEGQVQQQQELKQQAPLV